MRRRKGVGLVLTILVMAVLAVILSGPPMVVAQVESPSLVNTVNGAVGNTGNGDVRVPEVAQPPCTVGNGHMIHRNFNLHVNDAGLGIPGYNEHRGTTTLKNCDCGRCNRPVYSADTPDYPLLCIRV